MSVDRWQYLIVLGACLLITAPLESFGSGVYRQSRRAAAAVLPVAAVFLIWDAIAVAAHVWSYNPRYIGLVRLGDRIELGIDEFVDGADRELSAEHCAE